MGRAIQKKQNLSTNAADNMKVELYKMLNSKAAGTLTDNEALILFNLRQSAAVKRHLGLPVTEHESAAPRYKLSRGL
jgi:hypothetical protein